MVYQKTGRGGAGNFYTQEDIEQAANRASKDLEAPSIATNALLEDLAKSRADYVASGRGGAGNYHANAANLTAATADISPSLQESKPPEVGFKGRGGAGNYRDGDAEIKQNESKRVQDQEKASQQTVHDVEMGLKEPEKAHLGNEKME